MAYDERFNLGTEDTIWALANCRRLAYELYNPRYRAMWQLVLTYQMLLKHGVENAGDN